MRSALLLLVCCFSSISLAQDFSQLSSLNDLQKKAKSSIQLPEQPEIEHAVNEDEYIVGPGDVFTIIIGGQADDERQCMVTPEGKLLLAAIGSVKIDGLTLGEAKSLLRDRLATKYLADDIQITLTQVRLFRVAVSGAVNYPGMVTVSAMNRVSDAIFMAGGLIEPPPPFPKPENPQRKKRSGFDPITSIEITEKEYQELEEKTASRRNITIRRMDGTTLHADLLKFERAGNLEANPFLADGDVIIVPRKQAQIGEVSIFGALRTPGTFEYSRRDRIRDLIEMAHGFALNTDSSKIELARFVDNSERVETTVFELDWSDSDRLNQVLDTPLLPDDRLFVRSLPNFHYKKTVEIRGEVLYPGEYPLLDDSFYLSDIIKRAGGFTKEAALNGAYIVRQTYLDRKNRDFERLEYMSGLEMDRKERAFYREWAREMKGLVSSDFVKLFEQGDQNYDVELADQDLIVVPRKEYVVNVLGHVKKPGLVPFEPNRKAGYYIAKAGGYNVGAWKNRVRVQKAGTDQMLSAKSTVVEMGDTVFVPEKVERENLARDVALIAAQAATVVMFAVQAYWYMTRN